MADNNEKKIIDVMGVGSPIVDTLIRVENAVLATIGGEKGGMELVDEEWMAATLARIGGTHIEAPGGSAGNTAAGLARLGARVSFLGKVGNDIGGRFYVDRFAELGGDTTRFKHGSVANGRCLSLVTPDSERTMRTNLGAAMTLSPDEVTSADFEGVRHAHIEGYLLFNPDLMDKVLSSAVSTGCTVSLDLASFEVVNAAKDRLPGLLEHSVDVVFANEEEASAYFGGSGTPRDWARQLAEVCATAAVKVGKDGAYIAANGRVDHVPARLVESVVDTTGAGDLWAAGFLYGWSRGAPMDVCGRMGALLGAEVIQILGADIAAESWQRIRADKVFG